MRSLINFAFEYPSPCLCSNLISHVTGPSVVFVIYFDNHIAVTENVTESNQPKVGKRIIVSLCQL